MGAELVQDRGHVVVHRHHELLRDLGDGPVGADQPQDLYLAGCQDHGLEPRLVDARDVGHLPGLPKTDVLDAVWVCKVAERQMLRPSFAPPARSVSRGTSPATGSTRSRHGPPRRTESRSCSVRRFAQFWVWRRFASPRLFHLGCLHDRRRADDLVSGIACRVAAHVSEPGRSGSSR